MWLFIAILFIVVLAFFLKKAKPFIILSWIAFFFLGISTVDVNDERNSNRYFGKHISASDSTVLEIKKVLKAGRFHYKYEAEVVQVNDEITNGKTLLNIEIDTNSSVLMVDDRIYLTAMFSEVKASLNPHQFDYRGYLARQGIYQQLFLKKNQFLKLEKESSLLGFIAGIRSKIQNSLQQEKFSDDTYAVMNALLLGQRQEISKELTEDYARAGAIHILAVSGLHVGIILLILSFLLKPLERLKKGRIIKLILIVLFLWFFALLAGMSASVVRAVTMFSAVAIGQATQNRNSVEHSLILSMFLLLLCKPMFLFDVGFQLSYVAVFGIVWVQPKLYNIWKPKPSFIDKLWQLFTVSVAAQLAVLPLSLFYFHQFPALFWLSNLVIVPFLGIILTGGVLIIILSLVSLLPNFLVYFYDRIISLMNSFIEFISRQEAFLFTDISFSEFMMFASYLVIVFGIYLFYRLNARKLLLFLGSVAIFQIVLTFEKFQMNDINELVVFHKSRNSIYGVRERSKMKVYHSLDSIQINNEKILRSYKVRENVHLEFLQERPNYMEFLDQQVLIIDSMGVYDIKELHSPIILLKNSPNIHLNRLIAVLKPKQIIADGSNYKSAIELWKQTCIKTKTPFWATGQNGAYILE
tara:strand:- start:4962 stop:6875 length:1914 start_codon:yes stop_codon:yes gene_type:complete